MRAVRRRVELPHARTACAHLFLPALNLALFKLAMMIRLARAGTREVMLTDTVKFARAAGETPDGRSCRRHVLRLIAIPLVTVFGLEFGSTLAFAVVTETIFSWPGIGKLIIDSISSLDRPVMVAYLMLVAFLFIMINFTGRHRLCGARSAPARARGHDGRSRLAAGSSGTSSARTASRSGRSSS